MPVLLADLVRGLDEVWDPRTAEPWDAVGLVTGDPDRQVSRVLLAVDPVDAVVDEALAWGADLLLVHHPLLLRPVHGVAATSPKGRLVTALVRGGVALHVAHTNADVAVDGTSAALAEALGLQATRPLRPAAAPSLDKVVVFVPTASVAGVVDALADAGAGRLGAYSRCAWTTTGVGTFRPEPGARPAVGEVGAVETVGETRVEMVLPRERRATVVRALLASHPYEQPAYDVLELAALPGSVGLGRVGTLPEPVPLASFVERVAAALPRTVAGVRVAGDGDRSLARVAVCAGAGDDLFGEVRGCGADVYVTADLRHHPATEALAWGGLALVEISHWAGEWLWLPRAEARVREVAAAHGTTVETRVSTLVTDAWTARR